MGTRIPLTRGERYAILARDNFRCVDCGLHGSDVILEVHHMNKNPADNRPANLKTVCVTCHNVYHPWRVRYNLPTRFSERRKRIATKPSY